jgi:hypothetical protein
MFLSRQRKRARKFPHPRILTLAINFASSVLLALPVKEIFGHNHEDAYDIGRRGRK